MGLSWSASVSCRIALTLGKGDKTSKGKKTPTVGVGQAAQGLQWILCVNVPRIANEGAARRTGNSDELHLLQESASKREAGEWTASVSVGETVQC